MTTKVVVHLGPAGHVNSYIEVDGNRIPNVRAITISGAVGELTTATIEVVGVDVDIEAEDAAVDITAFGDTTKKYRKPKEPVRPQKWEGQ